MQQTLTPLEIYICAATFFNDWKEWINKYIEIKMPNYLFITSLKKKSEVILEQYVAIGML